MRNIDLLCNGGRPDFTFITLRTTSWMVPLVFPSWDMERRSVSMAWWLEHPSSDSPFTATSWSLMHKRPSCEHANKRDHDVTATCDGLLLFAYVRSDRSEPWTHESGPPMAPSDRLHVLPPPYGACVCCPLAHVSFTFTTQTFFVEPAAFIFAHLGAPDNIWSPCTQRLRG